MRLALAILAALALAGGACGSGDREGLGDEALAQALARSGGEGRPKADLWGGRVLPMSGAEPHTLSISLRLGLERKDELGALVVISRAISRGADGEFRITETRKLPQDARLTINGRDVVFDGERLAVRHRWKPWMERETLYGEHARLLEEAYQVAGPILQGFAEQIAWSEATGEERLFGMDVRWLEGSLRQGGSSSLPPEALEALRMHERDWVRWWGATHTLHKVTARVAHRVGSEEIVSARVYLEGRVSLPDAPADDPLQGARFVVDLEMKPEPTPPGISLELPPEAELMAPRRTRTWRMIEEVMGDQLAPVYRRE